MEFEIGIMLLQGLAGRAVRFALPSEAVHPPSSSSNRFPLFYSSTFPACNRSKLLNVLSLASTSLSQAKAAIDATEKARIISELRTKVRQNIVTNQQKDGTLMNKVVTAL